MTVRIAQPDADHMQDYLINWNAGPLGVVLRPDLGVDMPPVVSQLLPQPSLLKMAGVREGDLLISVDGKKTTRLGYEKVVRLLFQERLPMVLHFRSPLQERPRGVSRAVAEDPVRSRARTTSYARAQTLPSRPRGRSDVMQQIEQKRKSNEQNLSIESNGSSTLTKSKKKTSKQPKHGVKTEAEEKRLRKQYSVVWERGSLGISFRAYSSKVNVPCVDFISANRGQGRGMDLVCVNDVLIAINGEKTKALGVEKVLRWLHVVEKPVVLRFHASSNRVTDPVGELLPHSADEEDTSARIKRPTMPQTQPEFEPMPRPPRRNNSVDQGMQRMERGNVKDRENKLHLPVSQRFSRDRATYKQQSNEQESSYQFGGSNSKAKERRYTTSSMNVYARGRVQSYGDGATGDFRREPPTSVDEPISISHRRQQHKDSSRFNQPDQGQLLSVKSASCDDFRRQFQLKSKSSQPQITASARPRVVSRDSQVSNMSRLSFDEAANVVARATGRPVEECEFGGIPVLDIREGTVQSKLMYIYAKACLAKQVDKSTSKEFQPAHAPGNPLGRKTHSKYLSYTIFQDDAVASNHAPSSGNGYTSNESVVEQEEEYKVEDINNSVETKIADAPEHRLDERFAKMQEDISIPPPSVATQYDSLVGPASLVSSDTTSDVLPAPEPATDDFISLKDFVVEGGNLTERCTTASLNSTATPAQSMDGCDESEKALEDEADLINTNEEVIVETTGEASGEAVGDNMELVEPKETSCDDSKRVDPVMDENQEVEKHKVLIVLEEECSYKNEHEHADDHMDAENADEDDGVAGIDSISERGLAVHEENLPAINNTNEEATGEASGEASSEAVGDNMELVEQKETSCDESKRADPVMDENQEVENSKMMVVLEEECSYKNEHEHADDHMDAEVENADEDDGVADIDSISERDLAASMASLDDLLDFSFENGNHDEEEFDEFAGGDGDEEKNEEIIADDKKSMDTSLGMKLDQVQEEEVGDTDDHGDQNFHEEHQHDKENEEVEEKGETDEFEDGALSNPLVNERFRNIPDIREVIKDKPVLVVLIKESMLDEIQEILQSLQMELHFERHSTTAVGSSPLRLSQLDRDTEGQHCYRCGATGELAELNVASEQSELYCQECWELFFFSEDCQSPVIRTSKTLAPSELGRLTTDEDALDEALKYSFHDSSVTREDIAHPWRYLQGSSSTSSSMCDFNASSMTEQGDEVWL
ncbi:hypothetical protein KXD40_000835 [Peronospora effusa]|nr:hypothetical protein KXD40_000835 [Peronospora effusa]